ncbi:hypothetical protein [Ekhidna sp. To15]|uniref:hypothetical protein n=1 Tax=Ekhidna sp. To15 TaxID=3395267 RepID=UPI003F528CBC
MNEDKQSIVPKWLTELQQRSWEPEILLSGIVLYGMFKVPELLDDFLVFFKLNIFGNSSDINNLVALFKMGIYWLITGLILHLICRGIWIGMVGLSYTFPDGIVSKNISYKGKFKDRVENTPSYEHIVMKLEKISSSLFSLSFMLFMSLIGGYLFFLVLVIVPFTVAYVYLDLGFQGPLFDAFQIYVLVVVSIGLLGLVDFVTLGYLRRFKWFSKLYWPIHKLISILTLSRFYRPIYYGIVTNFNKWAFFLFLVAFAFISMVGAGAIANTIFPGDKVSRLEVWNSRQGYTAYSGNYIDQNVKQPSWRAQIPSDVISGNVLKLFVAAHIAYEERMLEHTPLDSLREIYPDTLSAALEAMVVQNYFKIGIDYQEANVPRWYFHYMLESDQRGFLTYLDISDLDEGVHHLQVSTYTDSTFSRIISDIPFYRDQTLAPIPKPAPKEEKESSPDFQPKPFGVRD